jgi:outer membrane lipoprotein carrier protein
MLTKTKDAMRIVITILEWRQVMILRCIVLLTALFLQTNGHAENSAMVRLNQLLANTQTMRADFTQTILDNNAKPLQKAVGKMALLRPGKFRWEVLRPTAQLVVANGLRLWIYDPDLEQVTIRLISKEMGETPALLLSNTQETLERNFTVREGEDSLTGIQWFVLTPKNQNSMLAAIKLGFVDHRIMAMFLEDHLGHTTVIEFKHVSVNAALPSSLFVFRVPANVDVIDETRSSSLFRAKPSMNDENII